VRLGKVFKFFLEISPIKTETFETFPPYKSFIELSSHENKKQGEQEQEIFLEIFPFRRFIYNNFFLLFDFLPEHACGGSGKIKVVELFRRATMDPKD
jgi:hypothetical protein